jgi:FkbM family methyltransferase
MDFIRQIMRREAGRVLLLLGAYNWPCLRQARQGLARRLRGYVETALGRRAVIIGKVAVPEFHFSFFGNLNDWLVRSYLLQGEPLYEAEEIALALAWMPEGGVVLDVGANHGTWGLALLGRAGPQGRAILVEANPALAQRLRQSVRGLSGHVVEAAAWSENGPAIPFYLGDEKTSGASSVRLHEYAVTHGHLHSERAITVPCRTIDSMVEELRLSRLDVIKIDVEFCEDEVIAGAERVLERYRPVLVVVETFPDSRTARYLLQLGYRMHLPQGGKLREVQTGAWGNFFFLRQ